MKKLHGYLLAGLLALSVLGGIASVLHKKDAVVAQAKDVEIDLGLKPSDYMTSTGYQIPTSNQWNVEVNTTSNPIDYENKSFTVPKGTTFQAHISASDNALVNKVSKFHFSFNVSVPGNITAVKLQTYGEKLKVISQVDFSDDTATSYSGDLTVDSSTYKGYRIRLERKNADIVISNFSLNSYETITSANVSFNMQGHGSQVSSQTVDIGNKVTQPSNPSETGYTFGGWYKEAACTNAWNFSTDTVSADMTLYAKWTANKYTVTFDKQSGTGGSNSVSATYNSAMPSATMPTRTGYTFNGYFTGKNSAGTKYYNANGSSAKNWNLTAATTLYAGWTANKYTVTFDKQSGTDGSNSVSATYGSAMPSATMPTRTGYTFNGYFTGKNGTGTKYYNANGSSALNWNIAEATTLYASWTANTYNVSYQGNKPEKAPGTVSNIPAGETWTYDTNQTLGTAPILNGYIFDGWYKESACSNKVGDANQTLTKPNLSATNNATVNLYAKWKFNAAVQAVVDKINETKTCSYDDLTGKINAADSAYNALDAELQAVVYSEGYTHILDNAKEADHVGDLIEALGEAENTQQWRDAVSAVRDAYDDLEDKTFIPATPIYKILTDDEAAVSVMDAINAIGDAHYTSASKTLIDSAQAAYNSYIEAGHPHAQIANYDDLVYANEVYNNVQSFVNKVNAITNNPFEYTPECKALIDEARNYYENTIDDYQKGIVHEDAEAYYQLLVNYENAYEASRLIDEINDMENNDACKERIEAARAAVDALDETSELPLMSEELLKELTDKEAAWAVIEKINAIYPMVYGDECKNAIAEARAAYDDLENDQQPLVINYDMLLKAEEDYAAVEAVVEEVASLSDIRYDDESYFKIDDARQHYETLTNDQKAFYPGDSLQDIVDYETAYEALEKIYEIGEVSYNTDSEEKVNAAREFYDSLTDEQKKLINSIDLRVLTKSEAEYNKLKKNANILVICLLIVVCLAILGAGFMLFLLLWKRKDDDDEDENKGTVKAYSFAGLPFGLLFVSHYLDPSYLSLYILSGVAVLAWIAVLVVFLIKRHQKKLAPVESPAVEAPAFEAAPAPAVAPVHAEPVANSEGEKDSEFGIQYVKSFSAKLSQADQELKDYYNSIKNYVLAYQKANSRISWHYDAVNVGRDQILKFAIKGKTLNLYLALDKADDKYKVEFVDSKKFEDTPCMYRIKNDRRCAYAKELIDIIMRKLNVEKGEVKNIDYSLPYESNEALYAKGLVRKFNASNVIPDSKEEVKEPLVQEVVIEKVHGKITAEEADKKMSDEVAQSKIKEDVASKKHEGKKGIINIDTISQNFNDGDEVTLEALWEKKLVAKNVGYVKVLARGYIDKKLHLDLQEYSLQAVKMILLEGGSVKKAK